jgi:hypothetical protein
VVSKRCYKIREIFDWSKGIDNANAPSYPIAIITSSPWSVGPDGTMTREVYAVD